MCLSKRVSSVAAGDVRAAAATVPNWRRIFRQPLKPKLSRNIITSAKVNLNRYWNKFEELATSSRSIGIVAVASHQASALTVAEENALNENLSNELQESSYSFYSTER